jgi:hypothetical protein
MSSKNKIAVLLFIVITSLSLWLYLRNHSGTIRKELFDFAVEDTASITKIFMVNSEGKQITLEKNKLGRWLVNGKFKPRKDALKNLLVTIKEMRVRNPVAKTGIETISKQLATSGTKVEIYNGEKLLKKYYVGADAQDGLGTFMLLTNTETGENSTLPFEMFIPGFNGFLSVRFFLNEELWRDTHIFSFYPDEISTISVQYKRFPDSSFTFSLNDKNEIALADSKGKNISNFDTLKAKRYITYYNNITYEGLRNDLRKSYKDSILSKGPVHTIVVTEKNGKAHTLKTFPKPPYDPKRINPQTGKPDEEDLERLYGLINDDKDFVTIQYYVIGKLFQGISYFTHSSTLSSQAPAVKK